MEPEFVKQHEKDRKSLERVATFLKIIAAICLLCLVALAVNLAVRFSLDTLRDMENYRILKERLNRYR